MNSKSAVPKASVLALAEQAHTLCEPLERGQADKPLTAALRLLSQADDSPLVVSILCLDAAARQAMAASQGGLPTAQGKVTCRVADCDGLLADMTLYQNFCRGAHVLLVVGDAACQLKPAHAELLCSLSEPIPLVWPMVIASGETEAAWLPSVRASASGAELPRTAQANDAALEADWHERLQAFREPLFLRQRSTAVAALLEMLASRAEQELAYLAQAQSRLEVPAKSPSTRGTADCDRELVPLRERLAERSAAIDRHLTLKSDRATQPLGELSGMMRSVCTSITIEDLDKTRTSALLKLSVNASHLARINRRIEHSLRQEFISDLQQVQRQMRQAADEVLAALCMRLGTGVQVKLPVMDVNHAWRSVENLMAIGKETHIELARKGVFDVLTAGRQKVFIIIMFASLMGRMGLPNLFGTPAAKTAFGLFMAAVMIGSMVNAVLHWRREKQLTSEKELSKIRDSLLAEGSKVIDQVERVKLTAMREYLKEAARIIECTVKQSVEDTLAEQRAKRESDLQRQEVLRKALDIRMKQATEVQRGVTKLLDQARGLATWAVGSLQELVARSQNSPPKQRGVSPDVSQDPARPPLTGAETILQPPETFAAASATASANASAAARQARLARATLAASDRPRGASALAERRRRRDLPVGEASEN